MWSNDLDIFIEAYCKHYRCANPLSNNLEEQFEFYPANGDQNENEDEDEENNSDEE